MKTKMVQRIPTFAAVVLVLLAVAACAFRLRGDDEQTNQPASADLEFVPLSKFTECRSVTNGENDALSECLKAWDENHGQFLEQKPSATSDTRAAHAGSSLFVAPKDDDRLPSDGSSIEQTGKE
ncbi:putative entry exclusion protein TrbK-alt [Bradyrhizobium sp. STM 3557]|uniref:putative entry exclusion protein TrbK-alt n=1 Tax=Bradyrhizobium sp. STM 3557 TaxID=578920 RepID=UPI00388ECC0D